MATTQTYVQEMQSLGTASNVQQHNQVSSVTTQQDTKTIQTIGQTDNVRGTQGHTTIIQPSQGGQQFIVTIAEPASGEQAGHDGLHGLQQGGSSSQVVYPSHAQYVEDSEHDMIYATSDGQIYAAYEDSKMMQSYQDYGQSAMYTPVSGTYYQTSATAGAAGLAQVGGLQGQLFTHQGSTYLVQGGTMDGEGHPLTHTTRASPATVQWLIDNYETAEGVSLPRSTLYNHYLRHCQDQKMDPMNPASFGKLIRSVFLGLRTRRLGTRGNSKYHYYGIRIKATSPLNQFTDDQTMALRQTPAHQGKRYKSLGRDGSDYSDSSMSAEPPTQQQQHQQFLGDAAAAIPVFGCVEIQPGTILPDGVNMDNIRMFETLYKEHSEAILDVVVNLQFSLIEALWQTFWRNASPDTHQCGDFENRLPKDILYKMAPFEPVQDFVRQSDYAFYQALVEVLIPDVLRPIPSSLTQAIRNFAKSLEGWLKSAMIGVPDDMIKTKVGAVSAFAQTLRRYTSLNHLAQAARAVLQNTSQINQMLTDLNRVDFANVQEQASWVCQCDDAIVHQLEQDFKKTLQQHNSLEQWAIWLESVVNQVLKPHEETTHFPKAARQFLLKWSFYSSMVIRDLTLRSAASFGSFHLIRLLYDEYMFYLVEHKVAAATGETPIAVMGEFIDMGNAGLTMLGGESPVAMQSTSHSSHSLTSAPTSAVLMPSLQDAASQSVLAATPRQQPHPAHTALPRTAATPTGYTIQPTNLARPAAAPVHSVSRPGGATPTVHTVMRPVHTVLSHGASAGSSAMASSNGTASTPSLLTANSTNHTNTVKVTLASGSISNSQQYGHTPTKTIVVVPVSAAASGDGHMAKKLKIL